MTQLRWSPNGAWQVCCMSPLHVPSHASGPLFFSSPCTLPTARVRGNCFLLSELTPRLSPIFLWARRHCLLSASHERKPISSSAPPPGTSSAPTVLHVSPAPPTFEEAVYAVSRQCGCAVSTMCIGHSGHSSPVYWIFPSKHGVLSPNSTQTKPNTSTPCLLPATANLSLYLGKTSLTGLHPGLHFPDHCFLIPIQTGFILLTPLLSSLPGAPRAPMPDQPLPSHLTHRGWSQWHPLPDQCSSCALHDSTLLISSNHTCCSFSGFLRTPPSPPKTYRWTVHGSAPESLQGQHCSLGESVWSCGFSSTNTSFMLTSLKLVTQSEPLLLELETQILLLDQHLHLVVEFTL